MKNQDILDGLEGSEIAVIGMAGRFPGAETADEFWQNMRDGVEAIRPYTDDELREAGVDEAMLRNPNYVKAGAPIDNLEMFDAGFFGFGPRDAAIMDPQHRHFLEVAWEALEHAGYDPDQYSGSIGIYGGSGHNAYLPLNLLTNPDLLQSVGFFLLRHTGNDKDFLTTRVSYLLNLTGPSVNVQTACSTSLVAIHLGVQSLLNQECDMILAGGVTFELPHRHGYLYHEGEILSPDGRCRPFDAQSEGTVFGSGVGLVVLKRLEDAINDGDTVHAVILGSAINNDGSGKVNYLAPSVDGQAAAIAEAIELAGVTADSISYVETHGTGTKIGDPIEVQALTQAFRNTTAAMGFCGIGSAKSSIGHLDTAAGIAGFIKTVQALKAKQLPPSLHFSQPNPLIDFENSPFYVNNSLREWTANGTPRRAGVSSLGVGGTNAHIILEEMAELELTDGGKRPFTLLLLSAKTKTALDGATARMAAYLRANPAVNLADVAYTLKVGRKPFPQRRVLAVRNREEAIAVLEAGDRKRLFSQRAVNEAASIVFMFPGGGAQYPNMGRELYEQEPTYRAKIDQCLNLLKPHLDIDLKRLMFPPIGEEEAAAKELQRPSRSLPSIFMTELAQAELWLSRGIEPVAMTGHSLGEYTAACLAGVFSVADGLEIVTLRGKLFETLPEGGMISVPLPESALQPLLVDGLSIAVINNPEMCVVSGKVESIKKMEAVLAEKEIESRRIPIKVAAHSPMLEPILAPFAERLAQMVFHAPKRPFISNMTGDWVDPKEVVDPQYWVRHLQNTVRFADGLATLMAEPERIFLEVGPGQTLNALVRQHPDKQKSHHSIPSMRHRKENVSDLWHWHSAIGKLWAAGAAMDWAADYTDEYRRRIPLPTYAFDHQRYWIEPGTRLATTMPPKLSQLTKLPNLEDWFYKPVWVKASLQPSPVEVVNWLIFADAYGVGKALGEKLIAAGHEVVYVTPSSHLMQVDLINYQINPLSATDFETLVSELDSQDRFPQRIVHLWALNEREKGETAVAAYEKNQQLGFYSLFYLAQALASEAASDPLTIKVISNGSQQVGQEAVPSPEKGTLAGPVKVIPQEMPNVQCQLIDVILPEAVTKAAIETDSAADFIGLLFDDIQAEAVDDSIAYRDGTRWLQTFEPAPLHADKQPIIKKEGVYLITGGLGGIGLVMAENLARQTAVTLILTSRSGLPPRDEWEAWQQKNGRSHRQSRAMQKITAMEAGGSQVTVAVADVTNRDEMTAVMREVMEKNGRVDGVIHAAGLLDDGLIPLKSYGDVERVLNPKVRGALILDELLHDQPLDFFILFSSTSSIVGLPGQIDYAAANAFLNTFAHSKSANGGTKTIAIDWGMWQEVGMAARAARGEERDEPDGKLMPHPLLDWLVVDTPDDIEYVTDYAVDRFWLLDQHRIKDGQALIPGTGYLEIAKAAIEKGNPNGTVEINDLTFMMPLEVADTERKRVRVQLQKVGPCYHFTVASRLNGGQGEWGEHVRGAVRHSERKAAPAHAVQEIMDRCNGRQLSYGLMEQNTRQEQLFMAFGPRWKTLRQLWFGKSEALAYLELPEQFRDDMGAFQIHPALMDLATSFALPLIDGYETSEDFFVPFNYRQVRIYEPLPAKIYSHVRLASDGASQSDTPVFDISIMDTAGKPIIEIEGFMQKRVAHEKMIQSGKTNRRRVNEGGLLDLALTEGILPDEGVEAFNRLLGSSSSAQIVVSSLDLHGLIERSRADDEDEGGVGLMLERPSLESDYEAPRNNVESALAEIWADLLGVKEVGIHDDFFELGGHSLIAVRLFAKIKKVLHVDLSLATLFEAPTIAECADLIVDELGEGVLEAVSTAANEPSRPRKRGRWSPLVTIEKGQGGKRPFFCVHGAGGNVLNFRALSRYLGKEQPFYGLQAVGVNGKREPLSTVEEMAAVYLEAVLEAQPEGPYQLGGYSGGGVIALDMAQRLQAQGKEVDIVVFFDTFHPHTGMKKQTFQKRLEELRQRGIYYLTERIQNKIARDYERLNNELKLRYYLSRGQALPHELRNLKLTNSFLYAASQYQPEPYNGRVVLFSAVETAEVYLHVGMDRGWNGLLPNLVVQQVPGNHDTMVLEPNVQVMINKLRIALAGEE